MSDEKARRRGRWYLVGVAVALAIRLLVYTEWRAWWPAVEVITRGAEYLCFAVWCVHRSWIYGYRTGRATQVGGGQ